MMHFANELLSIFREHSARYVAFAQEAVRDHGPRARLYDDADLRQMVDGTVGVIAEALAGESNEVRSTFLETVVPGLVVGVGEKFEVVTATVVHFGMRVSEDVLQHVSASIRNEVRDWLVVFFAEWTRDIAKAGAQCSVR